MNSSLWKFFSSLSAYVCVFFVFQIDKTTFFHSNTRHASIESFILSYYSVFYTLIKHWNARMSVHFFVVVRTVGSLVIMRDYSFTRVNARPMHRNRSSTVFWCAFLCSACTHAHTHRRPSLYQAEITVRMFQVFQITTVRSFYVLLHAVCIIISFHMKAEKKTTTTNRLKLIRCSDSIAWLFVIAMTAANALNPSRTVRRKNNNNRIVKTSKFIFEVSQTQAKQFDGKHECNCMLLQRTDKVTETGALKC